MNFIVTKTNNYWAHTVNDDLHNIKIGTTADELNCFFACMLLMSKNKKLQLNEYWSREELLKTDIFREIKCRDRHLVLLKMLHFEDNNQNSSDRIQKISRVSSRLQKSFKNSFYSFQNLCKVFYYTRANYLLNNIYRPKEANLALKRTCYATVKLATYIQVVIHT